MKNTLKGLWLVYLLIFFLFSSLSSALSAPSEYSGYFTVEDDYLFSWKGDSYQIEFTIQAKTTGWIAIGFQPSVMMKNADIIIAYYDTNQKKGVIKDCYSVGENGPHPEDTAIGGQNNIENYSINENNGSTITLFTRPLKTNDPYYDAVIDPDKTMKIIWAIGENDNPDSKHIKMGSNTINWKQNINTQGSESKQKSKPIHPIFMLTGLLLFAFAIWHVKRKNPYVKKFKIHIVLVSIGTITLLLGFTFQFIWLQIIKKPHFSVLHAWIGFSSLVLLMVCIIMAGLYFKQKNFRKRNAHISLGIAASVLALTAVILGKFLILNLF